MGIHLQSKHKYRNVFGDSNIQYHDFNNGDALTFKDKYTALLQQELQNLYWCLHDQNQIENQVPYQIIEYDDKGMFHMKLMDNTQVQIFIDNGATPSILPLSICHALKMMRAVVATSSDSQCRSLHKALGDIHPKLW